jgi:hypothetical protein
MTELRYHFRKCLPLVGIYVFGLFAMLWFLQSNLQADTYGETLFKECRNCGHLNYQFSNTCSMCGATGPFIDIWLKEDCDKRDAKKKKKKCFSKSIENQKTNGYSKEELYNYFIKPINYVLKNIIHCRDYYVDIYKEFDLKELDAAYSSLLEAREQLIVFHGLEEYRQSRKCDELIYRN